MPRETDGSGGAGGCLLNIVLKGVAMTMAVNREVLHGGRQNKGWECERDCVFWPVSGVRESERKCREVLAHN